MSLAGRLGRWKELAAAVETWAEGDGVHPPRGRRPQPGGSGAATGASPLPDPVQLARALGGTVAETEAGPVVCIETRFAHHELHGGEPLSSFLDVPLNRLVAVGAGPSERRPLPRAIAPEDVLFWDTETSGLTGGAGTFVIMAGFGRFTPGGVIVRQYVLPSPGGPEEAAFLQAAAEELTAARVLVSFNGKAFDTYQLENRLIMAGLARRAAAAFGGSVHLDLLHPARMLYRHHLASCSLGTLERQVLGYVRTDDIPGSEVPQRYSDYLDASAPHHLLPILRHNRDDVLSLVSLAALLGRRIAWARRLAVLPGEAAAEDSGAAGDSSAEGPLTREAGSPRWSSELYGLARLHALRGYTDAATALYRRLLAAPSLPRALGRRAALELADLHRRARRWAEAEQLWWQLIARDRLSFGAGPRCCRPHIELAKLLEHRRKNPAAALQLVEEAITLLHRHRSLAGMGRQDPSGPMADLIHRRRRLVAKVRSSQ